MGIKGQKTGKNGDFFGRKENWTKNLRGNNSQTNKDHNPTRCRDRADVVEKEDDCGRVEKKRRGRGICREDSEDLPYKPNKEANEAIYMGPCMQFASVEIWCYG